MVFLIISPGKTGTRSLEAYLKQEFPFDDVFRTHWLSEEGSEIFSKKCSFWSSQSLSDQINQNQLIRDKIEKKSVRILWTMRCPYAVILSSVFRNLEKWENLYGPLQDPEQIQNLIITICREDSIYYPLLYHFMIGADFFEREI